MLAPLMATISVASFQIKPTRDLETNSPVRLHIHARLHVSSSHSYASQAAFLAQEVASMAQD